MLSSTKEAIQILVRSLAPILTPAGLAITIEEDGAPTQVPVSIDRESKDKGKAYIAQLHTAQYGSAMSYRVCADVLKELQQELQPVSTPISKSRPSIAAAAVPQSVGTAPLSIDRTTELDPAEDLEPTAVKGVYLQRNTDTVYQWDRNASRYVPLPEWSIPQVPNRYAVTDVQGNTKIEYELSIKDHRQTIDRGELNNGAYIKRFPDLSNVETRWLKDTYATLIASEARKAPLTLKVRTTGAYDYDRDGERRLGYMLPSGAFLQSDGTFYPHTVLTKKLEPRDQDRWARFEERVLVSDDAIVDAYTFVQHVASNGLGLILLANSARCFAHFLSNDAFKAGHGIYLYGEPGSGKTELAGLARGLGQPYSFNGSFDATFRDTSASVEEDIDFYKDIPAVIDDLSKGKNDTDQVMRSKEKTLELIGRAAFDGTPIRKRMTQNMGRQNHRYVRTLPVITGERFIDNMAESGHRRILSIAVTRDLIHRKRTEDSTAYALDQAEPHASTLYGWGRRIILSLLRRSELDKDGLLQELQSRLKEYQEHIRAAVISLWADRQPMPFPSFADSLVDICAQTLIGARLLDVAAHEQTSCVADVFTALVPALYNHLCRMADVPAEKGAETSLQLALQELFEGMGSRRFYRLDGDSVTLFAYDYDRDEVPAVLSATGKSIPGHQWGETELMNPRARVALYVRPELNTVYVLPEGIDALAYILSKTEKYRDITPTGVKHLLIAEGLSKNEGDGRHLDKKFQRNDIQKRALLIPLDTFLAIVATVPPEDVDISVDLESSPATASPEAPSQTGLLDAPVVGTTAMQDAVPPAPARAAAVEASGDVPYDKRRIEEIQTLLHTHNFKKARTVAESIRGRKEKEAMFAAIERAEDSAQPGHTAPTLSA